MTYWWRPDSGSFDESLLAGLGLLPRFEDQAAAEQWLALYFGDLAEQGVGDVTLMDGDRVVYGPMGLA